MNHKASCSMLYWNYYIKLKKKDNKSRNNYFEEEMNWNTNNIWENIFFNKKQKSHQYTNYYQHYDLVTT